MNSSFIALGPGSEVIKLEFILRLKIKRYDWLLANKQPIIALYFEFENELKFYNLEAWSECVKADIKMCSLGSIDSLNREAWSLGVGHSSHLLPTPVPSSPAAVEK